MENSTNKKPQPRTSPIVDSFAGDLGFSIEGVSDHHMPSRYGNFNCIIELLQIEIVNFQNLRIKLIFKINGEINDLHNLYLDEYWKFHRTTSLLKKHEEFTKQWKSPAPIFGFMLNKYLQVINASCKLGEESLPLIFDQSVDLIALPNSFPPLVDIPEQEFHHYYDKKTTLFYTDLHLNEQYEFNIELEANAATFEFAPLFPFGQVQINKINIINSEYSIEPLGIIVKPVKSKRFSEWYEEELHRFENIGTPKHTRPNFKAASPYRGSMPLFDITQEVIVKEPESEDELDVILDSLSVNLNNPIILNNYETIRFGFVIMIPQDKDTEINVRVIQRPIPIRIYEQMQNMKGYQDVLIKYDIFNFSKEKLRLRIETEILGFTEKAIKLVYLHGMKNQQGQRSRITLTQCPLLKYGLIEQITKPIKAMMHCKVRNENTKDILYEETININLLANDEIIWELKDIRSNAKYGMHEFICSWITPRDSEGLIEKIRTQAALKRPGHSFGGEDFTDLSVIESHVRAVYDYLTEYGLTYVSQPFSSMPLMDGQRIVLPEIVLKNKAGNCIDLTILFASILEGVGLYSLIFLTKEHAFIGWGNKSKTDEIIFLETTAIGQCNFDEAIKLGKKVFQDNFTMVGAPNNWMPPLGMMGMIKGCHLIDTAEIRHSGKISARI
jgi:hypothetical protein